MLSAHKTDLSQLNEPYDLIIWTLLCHCHQVKAQTWLQLDVCRLCWGYQTLWPNQNQPTSTLRSRPAAGYWASDPGHAKCQTHFFFVINYVIEYLISCAHSVKQEINIKIKSTKRNPQWPCVCVSEVHLPCVGPSAGACTLTPVESWGCRLWCWLESVLGSCLWWSP